MEGNQIADRPIPFNRLSLVGNELQYVADSLNAGHVSGDGEFTRKCHALLESLLGVPKVLLTTSCTHALEMAALLLDVKPGDEVAIPSFTFVSSINAFALRGAKPVFIDIRRDTLNIDESHLASLASDRTTAIVPVHYAGVGCDMDAITKIAESCGAAVVEDNAHGLFGKFRGAKLGTLSQLATLSFHETKNVSCGEGGALIINDERFVERAEVIREKGTNRARFWRGQVDKYTWVDLGSSYLPSDMLAAFLYGQLEAWQKIQSRRKQIWDTYSIELDAWARRNGVTMPTVPVDCDQPYHLFYLLLPTLNDRTAFIAHLKSRGIQAVFHYQPLHLSPMGRQFGGREGDCPVAEDVSDRLVRLPLFFDLSAAELERVIETVIDWPNRSGE